MQLSVLTRRCVRVVTVAGIVTASVTACGGSDRPDSSGSASGSPSASSSPSGSSSPSSSPSSSSSVGTGALDADGRCGGGAFPTQVVKAADGVVVTLPKSWTIRTKPDRAYLSISLPGSKFPDAYLAVKRSSQTLDEVATETQRQTRKAAEVEAAKGLTRPGLSARVTRFRYDEDQDSAFGVFVTAVGGGIVVSGNMTADENAPLQKVAESCLSSVRRGG